MEAVKQWNEELKQLCQDYLEHDCYIYLGLIQKFAELEEIIHSSNTTAREENET